MTKFKEKYLNYLLIIIPSIIICIPLFSKDLNIYIDDGIQHICRLIGTQQTLESDQFLPMIMSNFCNNFGYSWNIFYSPITAYAPLIFKIFGMSYVGSLKMFMFAVTIFSGIAMYKFVLKVTKNKNIALLSAIIYIFAPYRITDMYIRTAIAELASFVFLPIVFNRNVHNNKRRKTFIHTCVGYNRANTNAYYYNVIYSDIMLYILSCIYNNQMHKKRKGHKKHFMESV